MTTLEKNKQKLLAFLACQNSPSSLKAAGWTPSDLKAAGWTPSDLKAAGWTPSDLMAAGWTPSDLMAAGWTPSDLKEFEDVPVLVKPYSTMLARIEAGQILHMQSTFGPDCDPKTNLCKTPMCTAGHLVNMAGKIGYELKRKYGWEIAAAIIHRKSRPDVPPQNFGGIPQEMAMAYIRERAAEEKD